MVDISPSSSSIMMTDAASNINNVSLMNTPNNSVEIAPRDQFTTNSDNAMSANTSQKRTGSGTIKNYNKPSYAPIEILENTRTIIANPISPTLSNQNTSLNNYFSQPRKEPLFKFGPYVPILRRDNGIFIDSLGIVNYSTETNTGACGNRLTCEILPDDAIVEAPSLVTPLLLKKRTRWPSRVIQPELETTSCSSELRKQLVDQPDNDLPDDYDDDEVQVIGVVNKPQALQDMEESPPQPPNVNHKTVDEYVKSTTVASLTNTKSSSNKSILAVEDYYKSSAGEMLLGIGLSRVLESNILSNLRRLNHKVKKNSGCDNGDLIKQIESFKANLTRIHTSNQTYDLEQKYRCPHCPFKSESSLVLSGHLEKPHVNHRKEFLCNWCDYKVKDSNQIVFHILMQHKERCRIEKPQAIHKCVYCPYECNSKRKMTRHMVRCEQFFPHSILLGPQEYGEHDFPAISSKFITQEDIIAYERTLKALRLAAYNPHQLKVSGHQPQGVNYHPILVVPKQNSTDASSSNAEMIGDQSQNDSNSIIANRYRLTSTGSLTAKTNSILDEDLHQNSSQVLNLLASQQNTNQVYRSILQYPRNQSPFVNGRFVIKTPADVVMAPYQQQPVVPTRPINPVRAKDNIQTISDDLADPMSGSTMNPKFSTFVICEICDGYIKDLNQLKSHMQWIHKVKIHQKMLESRPPLNCQKCQWRFFTDQGLERHLLGVHGLVTSNMQDLADQGVDSGRCTVCGRAFASKLVAHMKDVHRSNLKSAHLSYKCTVCSATFNLYRLFENHVYSVHSESVRRM